MKIDGYLIGPFDHAGFDVGHVLFTKDNGEKNARPFVFASSFDAATLRALRYAREQVRLLPHTPESSDAMVRITKLLNAVDP